MNMCLACGRGVPYQQDFLCEVCRKGIHKLETQTYQKIVYCKICGIKLKVQNLNRKSRKHPSTKRNIRNNRRKRRTTHRRNTTQTKHSRAYRDFNTSSKRTRKDSLKW